MNISVIIPTYNRLESLKKCLCSLLKTDRDDFEIIIVNDASTDGTKEYLNNLNNPKIKTIHHTENKGVSQSRNDGIKLSQSDIIAFTDDDCEAQDKWLDNLAQNFMTVALDAPQQSAGRTAVPPSVQTCPIKSARTRRFNSISLVR